MAESSLPNGWRCQFLSLRPDHQFQLPIIKMNSVKIILSGLVSFAVSSTAFAVYPVMVTKIVDPQHIANIIKTATETAATAARTAQVVQQTQTLVAFAGDPSAAVKNLSDLERINQSMKSLVGQDAGLDALLEDGRALVQLNAEAMRARRQIEVAGETRDSSPSLYEALDTAEALSRAVKEQVRRQQETRKNSADELAKAQQGLRNAKTDSETQAAAAQMQAIAAQQAILNGQLQQQTLELQIQKAEQERLEKEATIRATAEFDAKAEAARQAKEAMVAADSQANREAFSVVQGQALNFDWDAVR